MKKKVRQTVTKEIERQTVTKRNRQRSSNKER